MFVPGYKTLNFKDILITNIHVTCISSILTPPPPKKQKLWSKCKCGKPHSGKKISQFGYNFSFIEITKRPEADNES